MSDDKPQYIPIGRVEFGVSLNPALPPDKFYLKQQDDKDKEIMRLRAALRVFLQRDPLIEREDLGLLICAHCGMTCADYGDEIQHATDCAYVKAKELLEDNDQ